jgi:hypothetical protein
MKINVGCNSNMLGHFGVKKYSYHIKCKEIKTDVDLEVFSRYQYVQSFTLSI